MAERVIIKPRVGVSARAIVDWIERNFQEPGYWDKGPGSEGETVVIRGGNPLVNADVKVVDLP